MIFNNDNVQFKTHLYYIIILNIIIISSSSSDMEDTSYTKISKNSLTFQLGN